MRGKFLSLEGIDGAGKSTHIPFILGLLKENGINVVSSREPGGTAVGEKLRELLLHEKMHLETEALLMFASRREHIAQVIEPALSRGDWMLSDRFTDSSFAYQVGGRGLVLSKMEALERWVCGSLHPDLTFLFDLPLEVARTRLNRSTDLDKFEVEKQEFFAQVQIEYRRRAHQFPGRIKVLDSSQSVADIQDAIAVHLNVFLSSLKGSK